MAVPLFTFHERLLFQTELVIKSLVRFFNSFFTAADGSNLVGYNIEEDLKDQIVPLGITYAMPSLNKEHVSEIRIFFNGVHPSPRRSVLLGL